MPNTVVPGADKKETERSIAGAFGKSGGKKEKKSRGWLRMLLGDKPASESRRKAKELTAKEQEERAERGEKRTLFGN